MLDKMLDIIRLFCVLFIINKIQAQYMPINRKPVKYCDGSSKTTLVEHFFNLIFTEFHSTPPVCVCIQMCPHQSIYCYPNGCFKSNDKKMPEHLQPVSRLLSDDTRPPMFLVDHKNDYGTDFMRLAYSEESGTSAKTETTSAKYMQLDMFKDKYKSIFRRRKRPQVELRYNIRDQVKSMKVDLLKSENFDISKTRWPVKKYNKLNGNLFSKIYDANIPVVKTNKFFVSVLPDKDLTNYLPRYTKRELKNTGNSKEYIQTSYTTSQTNDTTSNTSFSIESLLNNLNENSFYSSDIESEVNRHDNEDDERNAATHNKTINGNLENSGTTNIMLMNYSNENLEHSKYVDIFNKMIANLSQKIEIQNNTSLEMMKHVSGNVEISKADILGDLVENKPLNNETSTKKHIVTTEMDVHNSTTQNIIVVEKNVSNTNTKTTTLRSSDNLQQRQNIGEITK